MTAFVLPALMFAQEAFVSQEPSKRNVLFEEFTGVKCGNCPRAHVTEAELLAANPGRLFAVNIHAGGFATPYAGDPNLQTEDGTMINAHFGISSYPAAVVSRHKFSGSYNASENYWSSYINQLMGMDSYVNIAAKGDLDWSTRKLSMTVQLYYTGTPSVSSNRIHVAMVQDGIIAKQSNSGYPNPDQETEDGKYIHLHVLRDMLTPALDGEEVTGIAQGSLVEKKFEWDLPTAINSVPLVLQNVHFVVFVTEDQNEVMTVCQAEIAHANAPDNILSMSKAEALVGSECDPSARVSFNLENLLGEAVQEVAFTLSSGAGTAEHVETFETPLNEGESVRVTTGSVALATSNNAEEVEVRITGVNGEPYEYEDAGTKITVEAIHRRATAPTSDIVLAICQDRWGSDITWDLKDGEGSVVSSGGPYRDLSGNGTRVNSTPVTLAEGCYTFTIHDVSKDGINTQYGAGYISMQDANSVEFYRHDGKYADSLVIKLDSRFVANEAFPAVAGVQLLPNPARDRAALSFTMEKAGPVRIQVWEKTGSCVLDMGAMNVEAGRTEVEIGLQDLSAGMYFVTLRGEGIDKAVKLVVIR